MLKTKSASPVRNVKYSERVSLAFGIEHIMRMRRIVLSSVVCPPLSYFSTLSDKRQEFRGRYFLNINYVVYLFLHNLSEKLFILRRIQGVNIINEHRS